MPDVNQQSTYEDEDVNHVLNGRSENVQEELKQTKASEEDKRQIMNILQRFNASDEASSSYPPGSLPASDASDEEESGGHDGLSSETLARVMAQVTRHVVHLAVHTPPVTAQTIVSRYSGVATCINAIAFPCCRFISCVLACRSSRGWSRTSRWQI